MAVRCLTNGRTRSEGQRALVHRLSSPSPVIAARRGESSCPQFMVIRDASREGTRPAEGPCATGQSSSWLPFSARPGPLLWLAPELRSRSPDASRGGVVPPYQSQPLPGGRAGWGTSGLSIIAFRASESSLEPEVTVSPTFVLSFWNAAPSALLPTTVAASPSASPQHPPPFEPHTELLPLTLPRSVL